MWDPDLDGASIKFPIDFAPKAAQSSAECKGFHFLVFLGGESR